MSFRNRCQITGAGGMINLSVPLEKGRDQKTLLKDVRISDRDNWQGQHWKTILSCYSRSPWLEFYRDELEGLYQKRFTFLLDWNLSCFEWSVGILKMPVSFSLTEEYQKEYKEKDWADWRGKILPKNRGIVGSIAQSSKDYTAGPENYPEYPGSPVLGSGISQDPGTPVSGSGDPIPGSGILVPDSGSSISGSDIPVHGSDNQAPGSSSPISGSGTPIPGSDNPLWSPSTRTAPIKYRQVFEERIGFLPNLSILDLLFCEGKNALSLLK